MVLVFRALFFGDFLLGQQKKVTRPPGRDPARRHEPSLKQNDAQVTAHDRATTTITGSPKETTMPTTTAINHQIRLAARPVGLPTRDNWQFTEEPVGEPADGGVLVKVLYLSLDPAMRGWMNDAKSYIPPVGIGEVMRAGGVGRVIASQNPKFAVGDLVSALLGVQEYMLVAEDQVKRNGMFRIDSRLGSTNQWLNV